MLAHCIKYITKHNADSSTVDNVDLPLKIGKTRIGTNEFNDDDASTIAETINSDIADLRPQNGSTAELSAQDDAKDLGLPPEQFKELDSGPTAAEVEGDEAVAELDASEPIAELPTDFEKRLELGNPGDVKRREPAMPY